MTRKDYVAISGAIREGILTTEVIYGENGYGPCLEILSEIKGVLKKDNPRFDEIRFDQACTDGTGLRLEKLTLFCV